MFCLASGDCDVAACRKRYFFLAFLWLLGLFLGAAFGIRQERFFQPEGALVGFSRISSFKMVLVLHIPFLLSLAGALIHVPLLIYSVAFLDAAAYGAVFASVTSCFPVSGWLVSGMLLFSKLAVQLLQFSFFRHCLFMDARSVFKEFCFFSLVIFGVVVLDYRFIAPIISEVLNRI